jgi:hypothetical protein
MQAWLASSFRRFYPSSPADNVTSLNLAIACGEQCSLQAVCRTGNHHRIIRAVVHASEPLTVVVRRVGYVPMPHHSTDTPLDDTDGVNHLPGFVHDPLLPDDTILAGPHETNAFWITVHIPLDTHPGHYHLIITLDTGDEEPQPLIPHINVHRATLGPRRDFPVTHWFYADALCD